MEIKKITKVLIANRSEIACRIIKACKELGIKTVAVYSEPDETALHSIIADEAYLIGEAAPKSSYLNIDKLIDVAINSNCDAIHPGYGFLSENREFNEKVRATGLIFIGPKSNEVNLLGSKIESRRLMIDNNIPIVPGFEVGNLEYSVIEDKVVNIGFPVLVKASAGGGGKGMRVVNNTSELEEAINSAQREALSAFGDGDIFIEKYILNPRHIEVQIAADKYGNTIHLFERECSLQRRHQKVIEETPSVALDDNLREKICSTAVRVVQSANYESVGTVEFIMDRDGNFYFLEVNTRIQVEHPITEMVTGVDLLKLQINIAQGYKLPYKQSDISQKGHSIECRIYAEDAKNNFMPTGGEVLFLKEPTGNGIRVDTGIIKGSVISPFYDPIMSKIIVHAETRELASLKMIEALKNTVILGVKNSIPFMINVLNSESFISGNTFTNVIGDNLTEWTKDLIDIEDENIGKKEFSKVLAAIALHKTNNKKSIDKSINPNNPNSNVWVEIGDMKFL